MISPSSPSPNQHMGNGSVKNGNAFIGTLKDVTITLSSKGDGQVTENAPSCLRSLRTTDPRVERRRIREEKDDFLKGSCDWVFENTAFKQFWEEDDIRCLWIHGDPGKGKTTMALAVIDEIASRAKQPTRDTSSGYISYFFCQGAIPGLNDAVSTLRGLIFVLIIEHPELVSPLQQALSREGSRLFEGNYGLHALWRVLQHILEDERVPSVYFVIDALDECNGLRDSFLSLLTRNTQDLPKAKWVITSRNEPQIKREIENNSLIRNTSLELSANHVRQALQEFIRVKVKALKYDERLREEVEAYLTTNADGTFLWVTLVCRELKNVVKRKVRSILHKFPSGLEALYGRMLEQIEQLPDFDDRECCVKILRATSIAYRPLRLGEVMFAADLPHDEFDESDVFELINRCGSFLHIRDDEMVYFVHQSAKDFLNGSTGHQVFHTSGKEEHRLFGLRLLELMSKKLKENICAFDHSEAYAISPASVECSRIDECIPPEVQYACLYWIQHFQSSEDQLPNNKIHQFLQAHLLHWLEALGWTGKVSEGIQAILALEAQISVDKSPKLYALVHDIKQFALYNRSLIEHAPLQLYSSALAFIPEKSVLKIHFEKRIPSWIQIKSKLQTNWSPVLQKLEGHSSIINSVVFSPNGKLIASGSGRRYYPNGDNTVRLWEAATGAPLQKLEGHSSCVTSIAFSTDSKLVASSSEDNTIKFWEVTTGDLLWTLKGHSRSINSIAFSRDGKKLASGSDDNMVRLWDAKTKAPLREFRGHSGAVTSVAFSPDSKVIASGSDDKTVRLWEVATGASLQRFRGHSLPVTSVAFSPVSKLLVSGSEDETVKLWRTVRGGSLLQTLEGHSSNVNSVAFSPDGKLIASSSGEWWRPRDNTVRLWAAATGAPLQRLKDHSSSVTSVAFSPDSKLVASGSDDEAIILWDLKTRAKTLEHHSTAVESVVFSPNGQLVALSLNDNTIRLWKGGAPSKTLKHPPGTIDSVAFSPDGKLVVAGSRDKFIIVWSTTTGMLRHWFYHTDLNSVNVVVFSPDGRVVASGLGNGVIYPDHTSVMLWDVETGEMIRELRGHSNIVTSVVFSPDGKLVASGSRGSCTGEGDTVRLWNAKTGVQLQIFYDHSEAIAFSPDSKLLASLSSSSSESFTIWETTTGAVRKWFRGHSNTVTSVAFSPDRKLVASSSNDKTVRLWDVTKGILLETLEIDAVVRNISFSASGQYLITDRGVLDFSYLRMLSGSYERSYAIFVGNNWVTEGGKKILWLPPDFRAGYVAVWNRSIISAQSSDNILFLELGQSQN